MTALLRWVGICARITRTAFGRKDVLPAKLAGCVRVLTPQSRWQEYAAVSTRQVLLVQDAPFLDLTSKGFYQADWQHGQPVASSFGIAHRDLKIAEIYIFH